MLSEILPLSFVFYLFCDKFMSIFVQDHNKDYIVEFPDWDPVTNTTLYVTTENQKQNLFNLQGSSRHFLLESGLSLPSPHLWYPTQEVIKALRLFLDARNDLVGSLTYRFVSNLLSSLIPFRCREGTT